MLLAGILLLATVRVVTTYQEFSQTYDEGAHIAAGMEWLSEKSYTREPQHPPLARIAAAVGPWLYGVPPPSADTLPARGNQILHSGDYTTMLALSRAGILPFFLASIVAVWLYARQISNDTGAAAAAFLYSNAPPALAHAGLATTDMAATAAFVWTVFLFHRWIARPTPLGAFLFGVAAAAAVGSKFSTILFLGIALPTVAICARLSGDLRVRLRPFAAHLVIATLAGALTLWAIYRFDVGPLRGSNLSYLELALPDEEPYFELARTLAFSDIPAPAIVGGIAEMLLHNRTGHASYLLGEYRLGGWWYYFPVAIAVKTTIPFLLLAVLSIVICLGLARRGKWAPLAPVVSACGIVVACFPSNINIGVRHVLPFYALMAITIGAAIAVLWSRGTRARLMILAVLLIDLGISLRAHPDYLAYFNIFAGPHPENVLLDSNLDWGQDLLRLVERTKELNIHALQLSYFGTADLSRHDLPPLLPLTYDEPSPGWFAVSEMHRGSHEHPVAFRWLHRFPRYERIGKSIRLYRIPGDAAITEIPPNFTPFIIPLKLGTVQGANGVTWSTVLDMENSGSQVVTLRALSGKEVSISPGTSARLETAPSDGASYLFVPRVNAESIEGEMTIRSTRPDGSHGGEIRLPVLGDRAMKQQLNFPDVPACGGCRRMIRLYAHRDQAVSILARSNVGEVSVEVQLSRRAMLEPSTFAADLDSLFPQRPGQQFSTLSVTSPAVPIWGFITVTADARSVLVLPK